MMIPSIGNWNFTMMNKDTDRLAWIMALAMALPFLVIQVLIVWTMLN